MGIKKAVDPIYSLDVSGDSRVSGLFVTDGIAVVTQNLNVNLDINGAQDLSLTRDATINRNLNVVSNIVGGAALTVTGNANLNNDATVSNNYEL